MDKRCKHLKGIKELKKQQESAKQNFKGKREPQKGRQKFRVAKPLFPEGICQSRYTWAWFWWLLCMVRAMSRTLVPGMVRHFTGYPAHINPGVPTAYISTALCIGAPTPTLLALGDKIGLPWH